MKIRFARAKASPEAILEAIAKRGEMKLVPLDRIVPNPWNPNKMSKEIFDNLLRGVQITLKETGTIPPILLRPHPTRSGMFQIIDGFHRYTVFKRLKLKAIPAQIVDASDALAKRLTLSLNYVRGAAEEESYANLLSDLVKEIGTDEVLPFIAESADAVEEMLKDYSVEIPEDLMRAVKAGPSLEDPTGEKAPRKASKRSGKEMILRLQPKDHISVSEALDVAGSQGTPESDASALAKVCREWLDSRAE